MEGFLLLFLYSRKRVFKEESTDVVYEKIKNSAKEHIRYCIILLVAVLSLICLGDYHIKVLQEDYNSQIKSLKQ